jgi:hypothetical protein
VLDGGSNWRLRRRSDLGDISCVAQDVDLRGGLNGRLCIRRASALSFSYFKSAWLMDNTHASHPPSEQLKTRSNWKVDSRWTDFLRWQILNRNG